MSLELAWDPATPPDRLHALLRSRSRAVRSAIAANPNTPLDDLDVLARHFADRVAANPVLDWLTITDADWLAELSERSRHRLLAAPNCPTGLLWWAVRFGDDDDRMAVTSNPACPADILAAFDGASDPDTDDGVVHAARLHVANVLADGFARDGDVDADVATDLDIDLEVRAGFADAAYLPELADLLASDLVPDWIVAALGVPADPDARRELARHRHASAGVLDALLGDEDDAARHAALNNPRSNRETVALWERLCANDPTISGDELEAISAGAFGRERVARHPNLDPSALGAYVEDPAWRVRESAARNRSLSLTQLAQLAMDPDRDVRAAVASNERLPISAVLALTLDPDGHVRAAANQRISAHGPFVPDDPASAGCEPLRVLLRRAWALRFDFGGHAAAAATALVEPFVDDADATLRLAFVSNPTIPVDAVRLFARDHDGSVRARVAERTDDTELLADFVSDFATDVRVGAAQNPALPGWLAARLATDGTDEVRVALVQRPDLGDGVLAQLLDVDPEAPLVAAVRRLVYVRRVGAERTAPAQAAPAVPTIDDEAEASAIAFAVQHPWLALAAVRIGGLGRNELSALAASPHWRVREAVAADPMIPEEAARVLAADVDNDVRAALASNRSIDPARHESFVTESDEKVRRALLSREDLPVSLVVAHLVGDDGIRADARLHPNLPADAAIDVDALSEGEPLAVNALERFTAGSARRLVVQHPSATAEMLHRASTDSNWTIREAVAAHRNTAPADLLVLSSDSDRDVRAAVAGNPGCPAEVLRALMNDEDLRVRRSAFGNPNTSADDRSAWDRASLRALLRNASPIARAIALLHPLGEPVMRRSQHRRSIHWIERWAVASNPQTPGWIRTLLANDANVLVRLAAKDHR